MHPVEGAIDGSVSQRDPLCETVAEIKRYLSSLISRLGVRGTSVRGTSEEQEVILASVLQL